MSAADRPQRLLALVLYLSMASLLLLCSVGPSSAQVASVFVEGNGPAFLAQDSAGFIYATALHDNNIVKLNSQLQVVGLINTTGANYLQEPLGLAIIGSVLYAVDGPSSNLLQFSTVTSALLAVTSLQSQGLSYPIGIAAAANGQSLFVLDITANPIHQLSLNGSLLQTFNTSAFLPNSFENAQSIAVDAGTGNVYVACYELSPQYLLITGEIFEFNPTTGTLLRVLNITTGTAIPSIPEGVGVTANGSAIFVSDSENASLLKFSSTGQLLFNVSLATNYYQTILSLFIDPAQQFVLVADSFNARIDKVDFNTGALLGTYKTSATAVLGPSSIAVLGSNVYITSSSMGYTSVVAQNGSQVAAYYLSTVPNHSPTAIAVDATGYTYVADSTYEQINKISPQGTIVQIFNTSSPTLSLSLSYAMAIAANGDLFVSDTGNSARIVHFSASGQVLGTFNVSVAGFKPLGLALLPNGQLVVVDGGNLRVYVLTTAGAVMTSWNYTKTWSPHSAAIGTSTSGQVQIFVTDATGLQVVVFSTTGQVLGTLTSTNPPLTTPAGLAVSTAGDLYVADQSSSRVLVFRNAVNAASSVLGDPQFTGLRGQSFQVHGIDGAVYALVSSPSTQVNALFVFLDSGRCVASAAHITECWSHPGSYLGAVSVQEVVTGQGTQRLLVKAGAHDMGFASAQLNGEALQVGQQMVRGHFSVHRPTSHQVIVRTADLQLTLSNSDRFINQRVEALTALSQMTAHGLLGQTHSGRVHASPLRYIEGEVDDYVVSNVFAHDFAYDLFEK